MVLLEETGDRALSTTLLITPNFGLGNSEGFMQFSDTLTNPLEALRLEDAIQLVFFHPLWEFRDGAQRAGGDDSAAANFARRSPFPMINILRTPQVRIAQRAIPTGVVYEQNEKTLKDIGAASLQRMLVERSWVDLKDKRVTRKSNDVYDAAKKIIDKYAEDNSDVEDDVLSTAKLLVRKYEGNDTGADDAGGTEENENPREGDDDDRALPSMGNSPESNNSNDEVDQMLDGMDLSSLLDAFNELDAQR